MDFPDEFVQRVKGIAKSNTELHTALDEGDVETVDRILMKASYNALMLYYEETKEGARAYPTTLKKVDITRSLYEDFLKLSA